jgi:enterochelin esterase-like enzyme
MTAVEPEPLALPSAVLGEPIRGYLLQPAEPPTGVVYLLHGRGGTAEDWLPVLAGLELPSLVLVVPDAPWSDRASWYVDSGARGGRKVETAFTQDLVRAIDWRFPKLATRERRIVGGVSMGGAGALRLALAYPELFGSLLALSPAIYPPPPPEGSTLRQHGAFGRGTSRFNLPTYRALHYRRLLGAAPRLRAFVAVGDTRDLGREAETVVADLVGAGSPAELHVYPGGHDWDTWGRALRDGLRALVTPIDAPP